MLSSNIPNEAKSNIIKLPFSLLIYKKATKFNISGELIKRLHFIDLQCLILSLEIDELNQYLRELRRISLQKQGIKEVKMATEDDFDKL